VQRGDVVVASSPSHPKQTVCKRCAPARQQHRAAQTRVAQPHAHAAHPRGRSILGLGGDVIRVPYVDPFGNIRERQETVRARAGRLRCAGSRDAHAPPQVPLHHVWLQGDNTRNSNDSRHYGALPVAMLRGRVCYRIWPPSEAGPIRAEPERCSIVAAGAVPFARPHAGWST